MNFNETGKLSELAIESLINMIGGDQEVLPLLDPQKGDDIVCETPQILEQYLNPLEQIFTANNYQAFILLIGQLRFEVEENNLSLIGQASTLLARIIQCQQQFSLIFFEKEGGQLLIETFLKLCDVQKSQPIKSLAFYKLSKLISQLGRVGHFFFEILCHQEILQPAQESLLNIKINNELIHNINSLDLIKDIMCYFKILLKNEFDKSKIVLSNTHQTIVKVIERLMELKDDFINSSHLCSVLREALNCLFVMLNDPIILHDLKKRKYYDILINFINNVTIKTQEVQDQEYFEIEGDTNSLARVFEVLYSCLEYQFKDDQRVVQQISKKFDQNSKLLTLPGIYFDSPYLLAKVLNIFYFLLICQNQSSSIQIQKKIKDDIQIFSKKIKLHYSKIPYITKLFQKIEEASSLLTQSKFKDLELLKNKIYDLNIQQILEQPKPTKQEEPPQEYKDVIKPDKEDVQKLRREIKPDVLQHYQTNQEDQKQINSENQQSVQKLQLMGQELENLINLFGVLGEYLPKDQERFVIVLDAIRAYSIDIKSALQVHQIGITESLLNTFFILDSIDIDISIKISTTISHLMQFEQAIKEAQLAIDFCEPIIYYLGSVQKQQTDVKKFQKQILVTSNILKALNYFLFKDSNIEQFISKNCIHLISNLITKQQDILVLCECVYLVDKLAYSDQLTFILIPLAKIETIQFLYSKFSQEIQFLQSFTLLVGTICRSENHQIQLGNIKIHKDFVNKLKQYQGDIQLAINTFYALSGLAYKNKLNTESLMKTDILDISKYYFQKYLEKHVLIETLCSMYSNITYKNDNNKKLIGDKKIIPDLISALLIYTSSQNQSRQKTIKQILRALGNSSLIFSISSQIISLDFIKIVNDYCIDLKYIEIGDNIKYLLDVITNLSQHPDQKNNEFTYLMYKQGVIKLVINCIKENQLNQEILKSGIDTIDSLIQNQKISNAFAQSEIIEMITKVMKTQDGNQEIILRAVRLIGNICNQQNNMDHIMKLPLCEILIHILKKIDEKQQVQGIGKIIKISEKFTYYVFRILQKIVEYQTNFVGVVSCIGYALRIKGQQKDYVINYVRLLHTLSKAANLSKQINNECIAFAIARSLEFRDHLEFGNHCIRIIEQLFLDPSNIEEIVNNDGIQLMASILKKQFVNDGTLEIVLKCLKQVCSNENYRKMCLEAQCYNYLNTVIKNMKQGTLLQQANITLFSMINEKDPAQRISNFSNKQDTDLSQEALNYLVKGVDCIMLRKDGSYKNGIIYLTKDKKYLCGRKKKGEEKEKYKIDVTQISDYKFNYIKDSKAWGYSVFQRLKGDLRLIQASKCVSIFGQILKNDIVGLNFILMDENVKIQFIKYFFELIDSIKPQQ